MHTIRVRWGRETAFKPKRARDGVSGLSGVNPGRVLVASKSIVTVIFACIRRPLLSWIPIDLAIGGGYW